MGGRSGGDGSWHMAGAGGGGAGRSLRVPEVSHPKRGTPHSASRTTPAVSPKDYDGRTLKGSPVVVWARSPVVFFRLPSPVCPLPLLRVLGRDADDLHAGATRHVDRVDDVLILDRRVALHEHDLLGPELEE